MPGKQWDDLFGGYARKLKEKHRQENEERALIAWYDEETKRVMALIAELVQERSRAFERVSGIHVDVKSPSRPPINVTPEGPFMSFIAIALGAREVHMYSHREGAHPPAIHYVVTGDADTRARKRVQARPACRIEQRRGGGFLLRDSAHAAVDRGAELSVDDVAFRGFEMLLNDA